MATLDQQKKLRELQASLNEVNEDLLLKPDLGPLSLKAEFGFRFEDLKKKIETAVTAR